MAQAEFDNKWGIINKEGIWLVPPQFKSIKIDKNGLVWAKAEKKWGLIHVIINK